MKYVAAYLLTVLGGKEPTKENLEALLGSVGIDWEPRGDTLLAALEGKDLAEVIKAGEEMLVKGGGGGAFPRSRCSAAACAAPTACARQRT